MSLCCQDNVPQPQRWIAHAMALKLLTIEMKDGSRHFGELPQTVLWHRLRNHIEKLEAEGSDICREVNGRRE